MTKALRSCGEAAAALLLVCGSIFIRGQAPSAGKTTQASRPEHVILISVDGMPPDSEGLKAAEIYADKCVYL